MIGTGDHLGTGASPSGPPSIPGRLYLPLRVGYGAVAIVEGADKFTNLLTDWTRYIPEFMAQALTLSPRALMICVGVCEIVVGLAVLGGPARVVGIAAYIMAAALVLIAVAAALAGFYDTAVSDLLLAVGAYTLGVMALTRNPNPGRGTKESVGLRSRV